MELYVAVLLIGLIHSSYGIECGLTKSGISNFIVGGVDASEGQLPWQVGLQVKASGNSWAMICGGTLVTDGNALRVITAAHCLSGTRPDAYRIVFGLHLRSQQNSNLAKIVQRSPIKVVPHSGYSSNTLRNDIAVFDFGSSFTMDTLAGTFASPACLPDVLHTSNEVAIVSGWGTIREGTSTYTDPLQYVTKHLMTNAECEQTGNKGQIDSTMLCAGDVGIDACQGDSGGPLVVNRNGRYTLVGIECGLTKSRISNYIVGGADALEGDYPWQVGLQVKSGNSWAMICGGTLVTDGNALRVITAAHCLSGIRPDTYRIVFGLHLRSQQNSNLNTIVQRSPTNVVPHSGYSSNTLSNDIAVFGFGSSFTMDTLAGTFASPACLPDVLHTTNEVGIVSGWGTIREGTSTYRDPLQFVTKNLMTNAECEQTGNKGQIDSTMLCAGDVGIDACQGDSGGPLVVNRNGRYTLVGVVSWGYGCGRYNYPGVYANVFNLMEFVRENFN